MGTIAQEIARIQGAKADLKTAIEAKGVTVPSATLIDGYATIVGQIPTGGGGYTGHVDTEGLQALGWDADDIAWLQAHVWWNEEDDAEWAVTEANKAFGPNGATPLTWDNRSTYKNNTDLRYYPKLATPGGGSIANLLQGYPNIVAIPAEDWDMTGKTNFNQAFGNCVSLRSLGNISRWNTSSVTIMSNMFSGCYHMREFDLSHWDTSAVTTFASMFGMCASLEEIDISGFNISSATTFASMFSGCYTLKSVKFPKNKTVSTVTTMASMFYQCRLLESVNLEGLTFSALTTLQDLFSGSPNVKSITIGVTSNSINQLKTMCASCFCAEEIDVSTLDTTGVDNAAIGTGDYQSPFYLCYSAKRIVLGNKFFKGSFTTIYMQTTQSWTRDSIYESLYTNQTLRDSSSPAVTVRLNTGAYDRLSSQDRDDIATKNITLQRG